ncbi:MAG TPA: S8 family serine peptidase, partial [Deinococcales bacterium]|nr:S8 family serine peptidase [Deinococcales bacterium]
MNNRGVILLLSALAALLLLAACGTADFTPAQQCLRGAAVPDGPAAAQPADAGGEILVRYRAGGADRSLQAAGLSRSHGLKVLEQGTGNMPDLVLAVGDALETADRLMTDPRVAWAVPNWRLQTLGGADCHAEQWNLAEFGAAAAWGRGPGRHRVTVAVIDSGIDTDHPALADAMLPGFNFFDMTTDPRPATTADHHGTHVAGIIAAHGEGPVTGIAAFPANIRIVPIRIFDDAGADA